MEENAGVEGHTAAAFVLSLEKKALGSNYGFPRDVVMFPERKKLILPGRWWDGQEPTIDPFSGDIRFDEGSFVEKPNSKANMHFGFEDEYGERHWLFSLESKTLTVLEGRKRATIAAHVDLPESVIDEDTIYEHCAARAGSETQTINFGEIASGIVPKWIEPRWLHTAVFPEFAVAYAAQWHAIVQDRSYKTYHYDAVDVFGHCAVGMTLFDENTYNVYWHVGTKRFYIGHYAGEVTHVIMLSWRVFIVMPISEFCYIGE